MSLEILQNLYYANMVYVRNSANTVRIEKRKDYQQVAYVDLKLLSHIAMMARENLAIFPGQYEQISMQAAEVTMLLIKWSKSDQNRYDTAFWFGSQPQGGIKKGKMCQNNVFWLYLLLSL